MAFTSRDLRFDEHLTPTTPDVGPGKYNTELYASKVRNVPSVGTGVRINPVPFGNSAIRTFVTDPAVFTPGPGDYAPNIPSKRSPTHRCLFSSQIERPDLDTSIAPGPGAYHKPAQWLRKAASQPETLASSAHLLSKSVTAFDFRTSLVSHQAEIARLRHSAVRTVPTIPVGEQTCGYESNEQGQLVLQKKRIVRHTGRDDDRVGVGEYAVDLNSQWTKHKPATSWSRYKVERSMEAMIGKDLDKPGPGAYTGDLIHPQRRRHRPTPDSAFHSSVPRIHQDNTGMTPGVGSYSVDARLSKPLAPQGCFGSTSSRFTPSAAVDTPGPGAYVAPLRNKPLSRDPVGLTFTSDQLQSFRKPFASTARRFDTKIKAEVPGPGAYDEVRDQKPSSSVSSFGSVTTRFDLKTDHASAPPSTAPASVYDEGRLKRLHSKKLRPYSVFSSKTDRFHDAAAKDASPPPGQYYSELPWMHKSSKVLSRTGEGPFASHGPRFIAEPKAYHQLMLGPGSYEAEFDASAPQQKAVSSVFVSNVPRFQGNNMLVSTVDPGPGWYDQEGSFVKKTYNVTIDS